MSNTSTNTVQRERAKRVSVSTPQQWEAVSSGIRFEMLELLTAIGPNSIAELAREMGVRADSLYHHMKKLVSAELVREVAFRRVGRQTEAVFDVVANKFDFDPSVENAVLMKLMRSIHRQTERNFERSLEGGIVDFSEKNRNTRIRADTASLTRKQLKEVKSHIEAIIQIFAEGRQEQKGDLFSVTLSMMPIKRDSSS